MIKNKLYLKCLEILKQQIEKYQREIDVVKEALENESGQSDNEDGGKGEMLNEIEKYAGYIETSERTKEQLKRIDVSQEHTVIGSGSLVETEKNFFFITVALGKLDLDDNKNYYSISTDAPIYEHLKGRKAGDSFSFNNMSYKIVNVL
jgi:transcription elongation GreA/GreB family factor